MTNITMARNKMNKMTPLCEIAFKYGTDKCPQIGHHYTPFYYELLKDKQNAIKKVLEIGIASRETLQWIPDQYQNGASLLMWREFFPNAQIYGIDIDPRTIFQAERIKTFLLNINDKLGIEKLISDIDLVIDDGSRKGRSQIHVAKTLLPLLKKECIYVIEDSKRVLDVSNKLSRVFETEPTEFSHGDSLIVVRKKNCN